jgi:uncharacterized protein (UPF0276 family)
MNHHERPYGAGLAYRTVLEEPIRQRRGTLDLLEISTEDYLVRQRRIWTDPDHSRLRALTEQFPCVAHGISLSLGSVEPLDEHYLRGTAEFLEESGIWHFSEHLAYQRMDGVDLSTFLCLPFDDRAVEWVARNYGAVRAAIGRPFALENVSYNFAVPGSRYTEPQFLREVLRRTDATLLLDVTNVFNNCTNHKQDPYEYLHTIPGDRVSQIHLAGGHYQDGYLIDSHSYPVMDEVWTLYDEALRHTQAEVVIVERDENFRPYARLFDDVRKARELFFRHRPASPPPRAAAAAAPAAVATAEAPDPADDRFAGLRHFQRAIIRAVSDEPFLARARRAPETLLAEYPMDAGWFARWRDCAPGEIDRLAQRWRWFRHEDRRALNEYRRIEWQEWARQLQAELS